MPSIRHESAPTCPTSLPARVEVRATRQPEYHDPGPSEADETLERLSPCNDDHSAEHSRSQDERSAESEHASRTDPETVGGFQDVRVPIRGLLDQDMLTSLPRETTTHNVMLQERPRAEAISPLGSSPATKRVLTGHRTARHSPVLL